MPIEPMLGWKDACQHQLLPDLCHPLVSIRTGGGGTVEGCTRLQSPRNGNSPSTGQIWSERTPPVLQEQAIKMIGVSAALVDAQIVQYGSTIVKSSVPVVLVLENEGGAWK